MYIYINHWLFFFIKFHDNLLFPEIDDDCDPDILESLMRIEILISIAPYGTCAESTFCPNEK